MSQIETVISPEVLAVRTRAMDILKGKWSHLYMFGYPQEPYPTNYENDLNCVMIGLLSTIPIEKTYTKAEIMGFLRWVIDSKKHGYVKHFHEAMIIYKLSSFEQLFQYYLTNIVGVEMAIPKSYTEAELKRAISLAQETIRGNYPYESTRATKYTETEILELLKK